MHKEHKEWINSTNTTLGQAAVTLTKYVGKASGTNLLGKEHMFGDFTKLYIASGMHTILFLKLYSAILDSKQLVYQLLMQ